MTKLATSNAAVWRKREAANALRIAQERRWRDENHDCRCQAPLLVRKYSLSWWCARCCGWLNG